jgi:hypothetical protein
MRAATTPLWLLTGQLVLGMLLLNSRSLFALTSIRWESEYGVSRCVFSVRDFFNPLSSHQDPYTILTPFHQGCTWVASQQLCTACKDCYTIYHYSIGSVIRWSGYSNLHSCCWCAFSSLQPSHPLHLALRAWGAPPPPPPPPPPLQARSLTPTNVVVPMTEKALSVVDGGSRG